VPLAMQEAFPPTLRIKTTIAVDRVKLTNQSVNGVAMDLP